MCRPLSSARSNPLFDATRARKKAEQDSILLANRIRLLRAEEARTRKKISETWISIKLTDVLVFSLSCFIMLIRFE